MNLNLLDKSITLKELVLHFREFTQCILEDSQWENHQKEIADEMLHVLFAIISIEFEYTTGRLPNEVIYESILHVLDDVRNKELINPLR